MQEGKRKVSIQLPGLPASSHSAELIMYLQYASMCGCVHTVGYAIITLILLKARHASEGLSHLVSSIVTKSSFVHFIEMLATCPFLHALYRLKQVKMQLVLLF